MADLEDSIGVRGESRDFATYLAELKQQGSALLITGDVSSSARAYASRQFMGETNISPIRRRMLIVTGSEDPEQYLPCSVSPSERYVRIIHTSRSARSTAAPSETSHEGDGLETLREKVSDVIAELRDQYDRDSAGTLRLGVTSLLPLIQQHGGHTVAELCDSLGSEIRASRGMAHYHLPVPDDERLVDALTATVDARIELRERDRRVEHRWDVSDEAFEGKTDWIAL